MNLVIVIGFYSLVSWGFLRLLAWLIMRFDFFTRHAKTMFNLMMVYLLVRLAATLLYEVVK
jgi:hypothetical protein